MFVLPFMISPFGYSFQAYLNTRIDIPIFTNTLTGLKRINKSSEQYNQGVRLLPGNSIKTELQPFFERMGIRKDLLVIEQLTTKSFNYSVGTNFFTKGDAAIFTCPNFEMTDKYACYWIMKHETAHIKYNDGFTMRLVPAICSLAAATFSTFKGFSLTSALLVTASVGFIAEILFSQYSERKADDLAIAESSIEELKGGRRFLLSFQQVHLENRKTTLQQMLISSSGENRLDYSHPSSQSRVQKIERVLRQKNVQIDEVEEAKKIADLKNLFIENISRLRKGNTGFFDVMTVIFNELTDIVNELMFKNTKNA